MTAQEEQRGQSLKSTPEASAGTPSSPKGAPARKPQGNDRVTRMGTASLPRLITEFAIPAILGMLVNAAYNLIDSIFLGQAMGEIGLSAATVAAPLMIVFMALAMLVGNGGNALAALRLGEGRKADAEISLGNTVTLGVILWIIIAAIAAYPPLLDAFLTFSSATDEVRPYAATFIQILSFGFVLQMIGMGVNNFIRTAGAPNRALLTMVIGAVVCTIFNYIFVLKLGWGVAGSAYATLIGQAASCISVLWFFIFTKNAPLKLHLHCMRPHAKIIRAILSLGLASFAVQAGAAVVNFAVNFLLVKYGYSAAARFQLRCEDHRACAQDALAGCGVRYLACRYDVGARASVPEPDRGPVRHHERVARRVHHLRAEGPAAHASFRGLPDCGLELLPGDRPADEVDDPLAHAPGAVSLAAHVLAA